MQSNNCKFSVTINVSNYLEKVAARIAERNSRNSLCNLPISRAIFNYRHTRRWRHSEVLPQWGHSHSTTCGKYLAQSTATVLATEYGHSESLHTATSEVDFQQSSSAWQIEGNVISRQKLRNGLNSVHSFVTVEVNKYQ